MEYREYMAFVDLLLRLLGENPIGYYPEDKWGIVLVHIVNNGPFFMPVILGAPPLIWLYIRKKNKKSISKQMAVTTVSIAVILALLGIFILEWVMEIGFGISYQRMYGDLFN